MVSVLLNIRAYLECLNIQIWTDFLIKKTDISLNSGLEGSNTRTQLGVFVTATHRI